MAMWNAINSILIGAVDVLASCTPWAGGPGATDLHMLTLLRESVRFKTRYDPAKWAESAVVRPHHRGAARGTPIMTTTDRGRRRPPPPPARSPTSCRTGAGSPTTGRVLTRRGELVTLARLTPTVVDGHTPEQLDAVLNRWQRMLSGIDARTRVYFYLLRRPATFPDADTGLSAVADLGQRKRRAFLGSRIQQIDTFVAWCYDPRLSAAAHGRTPSTRRGGNTTCRRG